MANVELNQAAPDFTLRNQDGQKVTLSELKGKFVVLYFYPKDNTPGCTAEGCLFRDFNVDLQKLGAVVLGVSGDSIESHKKFRREFDFPFDLLSDSEHKASGAYGTWGEKRMFGKVFTGMRRSTFLIDPKGRIVKIWRRANPQTNAKEAYEAIQEIVNK